MNVDKMRHQLDRTAPPDPPMTADRFAAALKSFIAAQCAYTVNRLAATEADPPPWLRSNATQ
jgi:hypothetical protein